MGMSELEPDEEKAVFHLFDKTPMVRDELNKIYTMSQHALISWYCDVMYDITSKETGDIYKVHVTRFQKQVQLVRLGTLKVGRITVVERSYNMSEHIGQYGLSDYLDEFLEQNEWYTVEAYEEISDAIGMDLLRFKEIGYDDREVNWEAWEDMIKSIFKISPHSPTKRNTWFNEWCMWYLAGELGEMYVREVEKEGFEAKRIDEWEDVLREIRDDWWS